MIEFDRKARIDREDAEDTEIASGLRRTMISSVLFGEAL